MRQLFGLCNSFATVSVMSFCLAGIAVAEVQPYTPERLDAVRAEAPFVAMHFLRPEGLADLSKFAEAIASEGPEAAGVKHVVVFPADEAALASLRSSPLLVFADPTSTAAEVMAIRDADLPAVLVFQKGSEKPLVRYFERGERTTPNVRSMNAHLCRAWRHAALARYPLDNGVALDGIDPVSYHNQGGPTPGNATIACEYKGITYRFATPENRRRFAEDPEKFLPAVGGWCVLAMARGEQVEVDEATFVIQNGRLYLFYKGIYGDSRAEFQADSAAIITAAEANWKRYLDAAGSGRR
jgi:YHS domain-containing protein